MVLDTGATAHLMKTTINHLLAKAQASNMSVRGAFGADRKPADRHGIAKMYILNTLEPRWHGTLPLANNASPTVFDFKRGELLFFRARQARVFSHRKG